MTAEKEMKKCSECKYNQPIGIGCGGSTEERLATIEKRLDVLEKTEQVETPKKPEVLLEIFKFIADTYTQEEIDKTTQLLQDEIAKATEHYHNMPKKDVYWGAGDDQL